MMEVFVCSDPKFYTKDVDMFDIHYAHKLRLITNDPRTIQFFTENQNIEYIKAFETNGTDPTEINFGYAMANARIEISTNDFNNIISIICREGIRYIVYAEDLL